MVIIFSPIIYGYLQVVYLGGEHIYIYLQIFVIALTILLSWIHPNLIAPLFNKFTELRDPVLRSKINAIAMKTGIKTQNIFIINSSLRSEHSNAYLYGIGSTKRIVLFDNLLQTLSREEIISVVIHEMGHSYYWHSFKKLCIYLVELQFMFYILSQFVKNEHVMKSFGFRDRSVFVCTAMYFHMFEPLTSVFNTLRLVANRKCQFEADEFACKQGYGRELKQSLIKLFKESTFTVKPDFLYAWVKDSHPSLHERIENINLSVNKFEGRDKEKESGQPVESQDD